MNEAQLSTLKDTLKGEFNAVFGKQAFNRYYVGIEIQGKDVIQHGDAFNRRSTMRNTNIKFVALHQYLGNYFMAYALDRATLKPRYDEQKQALLEAFRTNAPLHPLEPGKPIPAQQIEEVITELESVAEKMLKDCDYGQPAEPAAVA